MTKSISLDALWDSATPTKLVFSPDKFSHTQLHLEQGLLLRCG